MCFVEGGVACGPAGGTYAMSDDEAHVAFSCESEEGVLGSFHSMAEWDEEVLKRATPSPVPSPAVAPVDATTPRAADDTDTAGEMSASPVSPVTPPRETSFFALPDDFGEQFAAKLADGKHLDYTYPGAIMEEWHLTKSSISKLHDGHVLFGFLCKNGVNLNDEERSLCNSVINKSSFADEAKVNRVPVIDCFNMTPEEKGMTFIMSRALYIMPHVHHEALTLEHFVTPEYHKSCQPAATKIWTDCVKNGDPDTFRITKPIIPLIFKMTVQFKCSEIAAEDLPALAPLWGGVRVDKAFLLERTKRDARNNDMTKKCKNVCLYHTLPDGRGVLAANVTFIVNSQLPRVIASIIDKFGSMGTTESSETASRTRRHLYSYQTRIGFKHTPRPAAAEAPARRAPSLTTTSLSSQASHTSHGLTASTSSPSPCISNRATNTTSASTSAFETLEPGSASCALCTAPPQTAKRAGRRLRIRPPGCTDTSLYSMRTVY